MFKAKYFPRGSIFEASTATGSYAWQNILISRKVISLGMRWKIGNGRSIDIYKDNWLPRKGSAKIVSPRRPELNGAQVAALINPYTHSWDQNWLTRISYFLRQTGSKPFPYVGRINVIELFGLILHIGIIQSRLVIKNYVRKQILLTPPVQTRRNRSLFGKKFGSFRCLIKSKISYGVFVQMLCQQRRI